MEEARDPADWCALYREVGEAVFRMIHRMTGDPHRAEDLTHDAFVRVHERSHQFQGRGSVRAWVFGIARNLVLEDARNRRRRLRLLERRAPEVEAGLGGHAGAADPAGAEERILMEEALAALPPGQRTALLLHVVDGYSHAEVGAMLDIAEGSSKARVSRAKATLRRILETPDG